MLGTLRRRYSTFTRRWQSQLRVVGKVLDIITLLCSLAAFGCVVVHAGFDHTAAEYNRIGAIMRTAQWVFITNILYNGLVNYRDSRRSATVVRWIVDIAMLTSLLPLLYPQPVHPWLPWLKQLLYSNTYQYTLVLIYALVEICTWVQRCITRRTNPALLLSISFGLFIIIGALLLLLPKSTYYSISIVDSLFVSTSAVCITGLTTVDVATIFTPLGQFILLLLIQIGALGVLTFTSFFALFYSQGNSIYSQLMVKDLVYTRSFSELLPTILYILGFTLVIEAIGALLIFLTIHDTMPLSMSEEVWFAVFHSVSAFANAGFSTIAGGMSNPLLLRGTQWIYLVMTAIISAGSIGFPILINIKDVIFNKIRYIIRRPAMPMVHQWSMNTKIVLVTSVTLFVVGAVVFWVYEHNNSLAGMPLLNQVIQSLFNSAVPRSAGFSSVSPAAFAPVTLITVLVLMWIGGAAQSTAGGIKVNTFGAMLLGVRALLTGKPAVTAFKRTIAPESMQRVHTVIAISIISLIVYSLVLLTLEPTLPTKSILFETVSAVFTVGSSMGITPRLCVASKLVICSAMFFGRIGLLSLLMGLIGNGRHTPLRYPSDNIIIN